MPFICGGFPARDSTSELLPALERAGASIVEVGIPFSDPIADGPTIAAAMHNALSSGSTPLEVFDQIASVRGQVNIGIIAMCSISIAHRMGSGGGGGAGAFCKQAAAAGFDGLIIPDCPLEESAELRTAAASHGLTLSLLISPTSPPDRAVAIAQACSGFVYMLARTGITGESAAPPDISSRVRFLRSKTPLPIACGFGISTAEHVRAVVRDGGADAAIVGSALIRAQSEALKAGRDPLAAVDALVRSLAAGLV